MTIKLRNRLIALVCLLIFSALGGALFLNTSPGKPFAVILFIGDNITPTALTASRLFAGGGDARLQFEDFPHTAVCRNAANDFSVPESASASTAIAAGRRVNRGNLCVDPSGSKLPSLLEIAALRGRATGLVTTGEIIGITPAAYYAKTANSNDPSELLRQFCSHHPFDFVAGGGAAAFEASHAENKTGAVEAPLKVMADKGVVISRNITDLENQPLWKKVPVLGLMARGPLSNVESPDAETNAPSLSDLVRVGIKRLQNESHGYLLVVDDPSIASAASSNDAETMFRRVLAFDQAVATARRYAGENAIIIVTGRETIGGVQLNGYPFLKDKGVALLALNAQGYPSLCWSTGPGFAPEETPAGRKKTPALPGILSQPSAYALQSGVGIAGDVLSMGIGKGSDKLHGFLDLADIHRVLLNEL
jgi:alkaline phosphatase